MKIVNVTLKILSVCLALTVLFTTLPMSVSASPAVFFEEEDPVPINPNANQTCKNFYQYLWNLGKTDYMLSGVQSMMYTDVEYPGQDYNKIDAEGDNLKFLRQEFGYNPVIVGDMVESYARLYPGYVERIAKEYKNGCIPMFGFEAASFRKVQDDYSLDIKDWVANYDSTNPNRDMDMYNSYREELKIEADGFEAMEKAGVKVYLYRFFAEINNTRRRGFYGATDEGYAALHRVWQQAVEYFTVERGLTGILFVFCQCGYATSDKFWPGDDYVDIIGPTGYARASNGEIFSFENLADYDWIKTKNKPFGFTELGPRSFDSHERVCPIGDYKKILESMIYTYPECAFINTWYTDSHSLAQPGDLETYGNYNGIYYMNSPYMLSTDQIPDFSQGVIESNGIAQFYKEKKLMGNLNIGKFGASDLKKKGIDLSAVDSLETMHGTAVLAYESTDCTGDATIIYGNGQKLTKNFKNAKSLAVVKLENLAFEKNIWVENHDETSAVQLNDGFDTIWDIDPYDDGRISVVIDLGKEYNVGQMSLNHASFYEDMKYNLRDFEIYVSKDGYDYTLVYQNFGNVYSSSNFWFNPINARFIKLKVITPNSSLSEIEKNRTSMAEIEVYGVEADGIILGDTSGEVIVDKNQNTIGNTGGFINLNHNNNNSNNNITGGSAGSDTQTDGTVGTDADTDSDAELKAPAIVIPEFYNYIWIIIVGGLLLITGGISLLIFALNKKKNKIV